MVVHPQVVQHAHLAGCAAGKQGKFNEFKHEWWEKAYKARKMDDANIDVIAHDVGVDLGKFKSDMNGDDCKQRVDGDMAELAKFHVNSTPTFFVNGTHVGGAVPKEQFKQMIDDKLKAVESSGVPCGEYYEKEVMGKGEKQFRSSKDPKPG
jgi:predicted DsbA family dithiol-disulfide isomerase